MSDLYDLELLLSSPTPILVIESLEEPRVLQILVGLGGQLGRPVFRWSLAEGLGRADLGTPPQRITAEPAEVLRHIKSTPLAGLYVLLDFHPFIDHPLHVRLIKEIAQQHPELPRTLIFLSHRLEVPPEVRHLSAHFRLSLPDRSRLLGLIREEAELWQRRFPGQSIRADRTAVEQLATNLVGISESDARRLLRTAIQGDGAITQEDVQEVMRAKYALLSPEVAISFEYDTARFADLAGLENLKGWLERRRQPFLAPADPGDRPRGLMLLGVQGCGKSLAAKATAGRFGVPLLRLDFASLYNKYIGETEKNLRQALQVAEVMAPCVLWLDEIEKGLSPSSSDEGVGQRLLGTFLTWLSEHKRPLFVVATANDIERLPPELLRKGRFDEIFFVDLPDRDSRRSLLEIHLRRRKINPEELDLGLLADATTGYSGAEIEAVVVAARYAAQTEQRGPTTADLDREIVRTQPLSVVMAEQIASLRAWAEDRTVPAHPAQP